MFTSSVDKESATGACDCSYDEGYDEGYDEPDKACEEIGDKPSDKAGDKSCHNGGSAGVRSLFRRRCFCQMLSILLFLLLSFRKRQADAYCYQYEAVEAAPKTHTRDVGDGEECH